MPLLLAATPIGNADDASPRLRAALASADVIAAEDTRRIRRLMSTLGVEPAGRIVSYFDQNETQRAALLLERLRAGETVLVVTDAGTPLVSDPGYRLVAAAVAEDVPVHALPGPSAVTAALVVSGLPADRWCFEGFLPRKAGDRRRALAGLADERRTLVFFEAPHRLAATLADMSHAFGAERRGVVCRELTKTYEEVRRGGLAELVEWAQGEVRGEVTIVVAGAPDRVEDVGDEVLSRAVRERVQAGISRKDAATEVAERFGVARRRVYDLSHD